MKTTKSGRPCVPPEVQKIMAQCRKEFEFSFLLVRRASSEALRDELLGILKHSVYDLKDSMSAAIVVHVGVQCAKRRARLAPLPKPAPFEADHADYASAQIVLGKMKQG